MTDLEKYLIAYNNRDKLDFASEEQKKKDAKTGMMLAFAVGISLFFLLPVIFLLVCAFIGDFA